MQDCDARHLRQQCKSQIPVSDPAVDSEADAFRRRKGHNLSERVVIIPALKRCAVCGEQESEHAAEHEFELDASILKWARWYSLRRGVATTLAGLTKDGMSSKGPLRHTNLATTTQPYVKDVPENSQSAMNLLETLFNECSTAVTTRPN